MGSLVCIFAVHLAKAGFSQHCSFLKSLIKMSRIVIKPDFCICENKDADQVRGNREADQHLCFCYRDAKCQASSHLLLLYSLVCVGPGQKPRRPVFSQRGSNNFSVHM